MWYASMQFHWWKYRFCIGYDCNNSWMTINASKLCRKYSCWSIIFQHLYVHAISNDWNAKRFNHLKSAFCGFLNSEFGIWNLYPFSWPLYHQTKWFMFWISSVVCLVCVSGWVFAFCYVVIQVLVRVWMHVLVFHSGSLNGMCINDVRHTQFCFSRWISSFSCLIRIIPDFSRWSIKILCVDARTK